MAASSSRPPPFSNDHGSPGAWTPTMGCPSRSRLRWRRTRTPPSYSPPLTPSAIPAEGTHHPNPRAEQHSPSTYLPAPHQRDPTHLARLLVLIQWIGSVVRRLSAEALGGWRSRVTFQCVLHHFCAFLRGIRRIYPPGRRRAESSC